MGALLPLRATVYAFVWAEVLQITYRLMVGDPFAWRSLVPSSSGLIIGFLSGVAFAWLQTRYHWLLTALAIALLQAEMVAWVGHYGDILGTLLPPTLLAALAASLAAHESKTRPEAMAWLERLLGGDADGLARRTLAARALEQGSKDGIQAASEGETEAFRALDRAVLVALSGEGLETLGALAHQLASSEA